MPDAEENRCRLCLVTPADCEPRSFRTQLEAALAGGDVASLIVTAAPPALQALAEAAVPVAQAHGAAAIVYNDTRIAGRAKADGVHVDGGVDDLRLAVEALRPDRIVGAGGLRSRHDAMLAGEADADYLFFGRLDGDTLDGIHPKTLDLAAWWSSMFVIPAMVMGGRTIASVAEAADSRIEFVALRDAVWWHAEGPGAAVREANRLLAGMREPAA